MMQSGRYPSTALQILLHLRAHHPNLSLRAATTFLMICENEEISISELAFLMDETSYNVSRSIDQINQGTGGGTLVDRVAWRHDGRLRVVRLTGAGEQLRQRLNETILQARPIGDHPDSRPRSAAPGLQDNALMARAVPLRSVGG